MRPLSELDQSTDLEIDEEFQLDIRISTVNGPPGAALDTATGFTACAVTECIAHTCFSCFTGGGHCCN